MTGFVERVLRDIASKKVLSINSWCDFQFNEVMKRIRDSESITTIRIESDDLYQRTRIRTEEEIALLFETLGTLPNLKILVLSYVVYSTSDVEYFERYLRAIPSPLSKLRTIGTGEIPPSTFRALASVPTMTTLRVKCRQEIDGKSYIDGESMVRDLILNNSTLKIIEFHGDCYNREMCDALADLLRLNTTLETLHLPRIYSQDRGPAIEALLNSLKNNSKLKSLKLEGNPLHADTLCNTLADVLGVNSTLQEFAMPRCKDVPTRPALQALVNTMKNSNHSLQKLSMHYEGCLDDRDYHELMWYIEINGRGGRRLKAENRAKSGPDPKLILARGIRKYHLDWLYYVLRECPELCKSRENAVPC